MFVYIYINISTYISIIDSTYRMIYLTVRLSIFVCTYTFTLIIMRYPTEYLTVACQPALAKARARRNRSQLRDELSPQRVLLLRSSADDPRKL